MSRQTTAAMSPFDHETTDSNISLVGVVVRMYISLNLFNLTRMHPCISVRRPHGLADLALSMYVCMYVAARLSCIRWL